jgi:hypothetical protein
VLHHLLTYTPQNTEFSVNIIPSKDEENNNNNPDTGYFSWNLVKGRSPPNIEFFDHFGHALIACDPSKSILLIPIDLQH